MSTTALPARTMSRVAKPSRRRCICHGPMTHVGSQDGRPVLSGCVWCVRAWTVGRLVLAGRERAA